MCTRRWNNPIVRKDSAGTVYVFLDDSIIDVDPDGSLDEGGSGGGGGFGLGVNSSYYTAKSTQAYDWNWQNSSYNCNQLCFVAGTLVQCEAGTTPIEEIEAGDLVWAWDEETGDVALKEVVETYVNETSELVHIFVNGEEIVTTPAHPFYSPVKGWTEAVHLRAGDILVLVNGEYVVVEKVQHEILEAPVPVYNFQVEDYHTYYVAIVAVLVHNSCINDHQTRNTQQENIQFDSEGQARSFARTQVGHNPIPNGEGKLVSTDMRWQYRAKSIDFMNGHIHLERLNPETGEVIINYHLWW